MERLTNENHKELGFFAYVGSKNPFEAPITIGELAASLNEDYSPRKILEEVFAHLAAYEDTMPLERAQELAQIEKEGRLLVLPCKVGDVVWVNDDCVRDWSGTPLPYKCWVFGTEITGKWKRFHVECYKTGRIFPFDFDKFGQTVFLTREEAEAALKKREEACEIESI